MGSNRLKLLLVSMLAVFAISAIASASASAGCYKVNKAGSGTWLTNTCTTTGATKEYVKATLVGHVAGESGVWCAKVEAGEPSTYKNNTCTEEKTGTGEYTKVMESWDEYEVCQEGGTEKYTEHKCSTKSGTGKWSWLPIPAGKKFPVESTGKAFELTNGIKSSDCKAVTNTGEIEATGKSSGITLKFTGCENDPKTCEAFSKGKPGTKEIEVTGLTDQLVQRHTHGGGGPVVADEFKENATTKEFVTIEFKEGAVACPNYPPTKVKGQVAGECKNATTSGGVGVTELVFPNPELEGNSLEAFGVKSSLFGTANVFISGTDKEWSVRCE